MSKDKDVVFPLSEIQFEFIKIRNQQAQDLVKDAIRKLAKELNVPLGVNVRLSENLKTLVVIPDSK